VTFVWNSWPGFALALAAGLVVEAALVIVLALVVRIAARLRPAFDLAMRRSIPPLLVLAGVVLLEFAVAFAWPHEPSRNALAHVLLIVGIAAAAWYLVAVIGAASDRVVMRHRIDIADNREARRVHTQIAVIRRLAVVIVWLLAAGVAIFTVPGAEAVGTSILASAGLASVVAGIAAQSVLGNIFAGVQLAFSGAIRVDDVVIANGEWGRIEAITLTYVVLKVWDERRLVLPSTYFTTNPFENWTRQTSQLLGTVEFDVDWRISPAAMRARLAEILSGTPLWDRRASGLVVEDATGGLVRVRALVSAANSSEQFDLRCLVREQLVEWVVAQTPEAVPTRRVAVERQE